MTREATRVDKGRKKSKKGREIDVGQGSICIRFVKRRVKRKEGWDQRIAGMRGIRLVISKEKLSDGVSDCGIGSK